MIINLIKSIRIGSILTEEAKHILSLGLHNKVYFEYFQNNAWRNWFIQGYIDGVGKHIPGLFWHSCISPWQYNHVIQRS